MRWGVAGCGWVARDFLAPALVADPAAELVALCDPSASARERLAATLPTGHPAPECSTADPAALLAAGLDAVYVATPNHLHRPLVEAAAAAGVAVLCEKPMAATLADAEAMVDACARAGVAYATAYDQRHHPAHTALAGLVASGDLGTVTAVRIAYGCWLPPAWSPDGRAHDNWRADPARAGGGALVDLAPHGLDLVGVLLGGDDVVQVHAHGQRRVHDYGVDDGAVLSGRTGDGVLVSQHVSYNTPDALPRRRLEVAGTAGLAVAVDTMGQDAGGRLTVHRDDGTGGATVSEIRFDAAVPPFAAMVAAYGAWRRGEATWPSTPARDLRHMALLAAAAQQVAADLAGAEPAALP